jgi:hypothetical protein
MTRGDITAISLEHWKIALLTGGLSGFLGVVFSIGPLLRLYGHALFFALITFLGTVLSDWVIHPSHFGGEWTEALVTGSVAALASLVLSYTPIGDLLQKLEADHHIADSRHRIMGKRAQKPRKK